MDIFNKMLTALITALVGIILLASVIIPIGLEQINNLSKSSIEGSAGFTTILTVVLTISVVIVIIALLRFFTSNKSE